MQDLMSKKQNDKKESFVHIKQLPVTSENYHKIIDLCDSFCELYGDIDMFLELVDYHTAAYQQLSKSPFHIEFPYPYNYN